jgi:hypothetical protein
MKSSNICTAFDVPTAGRQTHRLLLEPEALSHLDIVYICQYIFHVQSRLEHTFTSSAPNFHPPPPLLFASSLVLTRAIITQICRSILFGLTPGKMPFQRPPQQTQSQSSVRGITKGLLAVPPGDSTGQTGPSSSRIYRFHSCPSTPPLQDACSVTAAPSLSCY